MKRTAWDNLRLLRASDTGSLVELIGRFVLMAAGTLTVAWWTTDPNLLIWITCYSVTQAIYIRFLHSARQDLASWQYPLALALNIVSSGTFAVLPIYLWLMGNVTLQASAICVIWTHAIYNSARYPVPRGIAIWDALSISALVLYIAYDLSHGRPDGIEKWIPFFVASIVTAYFNVSIFENYRRANRLEQAETNLIERERLDAVGRITGGVAHDFNNILTVILGQIDLFRQADSPHEKSAAIAAVEDAASRAARLTRKLQAYAQLSVLQPTEHRIDHLIEDVLTNLALPEDQFTLNISDAVAASPTVMIDVAQTRAVLLDLILNAIEASDEAQTVSVFADFEVLIRNSLPMHGVVLSPGRYLVVEVSDTGRGISVQEMRHVFEPFYSTKRAPHSSGLGLAMASGFARQAGGALHVVSKIGKGTIVTLYLPL